MVAEEHAQPSLRSAGRGPYIVHVVKSAARIIGSVAICAWPVTNQLLLLLPRGAITSQTIHFLTLQVDNTWFISMVCQRVTGQFASVAQTQQEGKSYYIRVLFQLLCS